jgi:hypothetical protein
VELEELQAMKQVGWKFVSNELVSTCVMCGCCCCAGTLCLLWQGW